MMPQSTSGHLIPEPYGLSLRPRMTNTVPGIMGLLRNSEFLKNKSDIFSDGELAGSGRSPTVVW
jgi:hypothetical protein